MGSLGRRMKYRLGIYHKRPAVKCRRRKKMPPHVVFCFLAAAILILCGIGLRTAEHRLGNIAGEIASSRLSGEVSDACSNAVLEVADEMELSYDRIFNAKEKEGQITSVAADFKEVNRFKSSLLLKIRENLRTREKINVSVPAGALISNNLWAGSGVDIPVSMIVTDSIEMKFIDDFDSAGINQTRHRVMLHIKVPAAVNAPGYKKETEVTVDLPIAENIIVGTVPDTYLSLGD